MTRGAHLDKFEGFSVRTNGILFQVRRIVYVETKAISALAYAYHKKHSRLQGYLMLATFIREQAIPPRCPPRFETSIMRRLEAAYVLRGERIELVDGLFVRYNLLPELSILHVFKRTNCRPWGVADRCPTLH